MVTGLALWEQLDELDAKIHSLIENFEETEDLEALQLGLSRLGEYAYALASPVSEIVYALQRMGTHASADIAPAPARLY